MEREGRQGYFIKGLNLKTGPNGQVVAGGKSLNKVFLDEV